MPEVFTNESLEVLIAGICREGDELSDVTLDFVQCLIKRHNLFDCNLEPLNDKNVSSVIRDALIQKISPTKEQINLMDKSTQIKFIIQLIWLCGLYSIEYYTKNQETESLDLVLAMMDVSDGHALGGYLFCVITLLHSRVPTVDFVAQLTNEFDDSYENIVTTQDYFKDLLYSLLCRWKEDQKYYIC